MVSPSGSDSCLATMANRRMKVLLFTVHFFFCFSLSFTHHHALSLLLAVTLSVSPCYHSCSHTVTVCLSHGAGLSHVLSVPDQLVISGCYRHKLQEVHPQIFFTYKVISIIVSYRCSFSPNIWHIHRKLKGFEKYSIITWKGFLVVTNLQSLQVYEGF